MAAAQQIQAMAAVNAAAAIASANNNPEVAHKRPRLEMTHLAAPALPVSSATPAAAISQPLRIDTREAVKVRKKYHFAESLLENVTHFIGPPCPRPIVAGVQ